MFTKEQEARIRMWLLNKQLRSTLAAMANFGIVANGCRVAFLWLAEAWGPELLLAVTGSGAEGEA